MAWTSWLQGLANKPCVLFSVALYGYWYHLRVIWSVTIDECGTSSAAGETAEKYGWWLLAANRLRWIITLWISPSKCRKRQSTFFWSVERVLIKFVRYDILRSVTFISFGIITMSISLHKVRAENGKNPTLHKKFGRTYRYTLEIRVTAARFVRRTSDENTALHN